MLLCDVVNGDFSGKVSMDSGMQWHGPEASKFKGITFIHGNIHYAPGDIKRVVQLESAQSSSMGKSIAKGIAGGLLFGGIGAIAGATSGGKVNMVRYGIEFKDGKKVIIENTPGADALAAFLLYIKQERIFEQNLGF
jgi:hypothetical protein